MADRPIDQLPVKTAAQLALTDFVIGHGDDAPAAFRSELDEVLDFLGPTLVSRFSDDIAGEVVDGGEVGGDRYFRFAGGFQVCWTGTGYFTYNNAQSLTYVWTYPAAFASGPVIKHPAMPTSGSNFEGGLNLNNIGSPFFASTPGPSSATCYLWNNSTSWSAGHAINSVRLMALGRWM